MRKKSEMQKANEEFVKTYDDSKYPKLSIPIKMSTFFGNSEHPFPEK